HPSRDRPSHRRSSGNRLARQQGPRSTRGRFCCQGHHGSCPRNPCNVADLFPSGAHDPTGINGAVWQALDESDTPFELAQDTSLTLAAYVADTPVEIYLRYPAVGQPLPSVPLFLTPDHYVPLPLESTYQEAFRGMPDVWRSILESGSARQP